MTKFTKIYTDEQKRALVVHALEKSCTARKAVNALNAGELGVPAPDPPMGLQYARDLIGTERERRASIRRSKIPKLPLHQATEQVGQELMNMLDLEIARSQRAQKKGHLTLLELHGLAKAAREVKAYIGAAQNGGGEPTDPDGDKPTSSDALSNLAAAHKRDTEPEQADPQAPPDPENGNAAPDTTTENNTAGENGAADEFSRARPVRGDGGVDLERAAQAPAAASLLQNL